MEFIYGRDKRAKKDVKVILEGEYGNMYNFEQYKRNKILESDRQQQE